MASLNEHAKVLRASTLKDLPEIMRIIDEARESINRLGIVQWTDRYPASKHIQHDIEQGWSYVLVDQAGKILATEAVSFDGDPSYETIEGHDWQYEGAYATVHRLAVDPAYRGQGLSALLFAGAEALAVARGIKIVRVDTHEGNVPMKRALERNGYERRGMIHLEDGALRRAYEKLIP